ncbi:class F sortase [Actinomycetospora straminea]|uniref:class F sortase n=1 Tax=Actinomycetospora straminea TaxID=663607 RepID=UPI0023661D83|nr:class F sortase [Actinomycetospora straminea]MDD7930960.1 class F sortase [Actinomycetospora straminea]
MAASEAASDALAPPPVAGPEVPDRAGEDHEDSTHPEQAGEVRDVLVITERPGPDRTRRALLVGAALLAVLGVALLGWAVGHQTSAPPVPVAAPVAAPVAPGPPPPASLATAPPASPNTPNAPPATLRIPAIGVDSPVDQVGLNPDRTMEVPAEGSPGYDHAAWFRYSVTPGRQGPSVLIGHVDSAASGPSVFYELGRLRPGDRADVVRADGVTVTFEVTEVVVVPKDAFPTDRVYGPTRGPELRLITCGGSFDRGAGSYRDNTVVFARAVA